MRLSWMVTALVALPAAATAQPAGGGPAETPEGAYLVYGEPGGVGFITYNGLQAQANQWPMSFYYYRDGAPSGSATMLGGADCQAGIVTGALTTARGQDGARLELPPPAERPAFTFERTGGAGDQAIVAFICNDAGGRRYLADAPAAGALDGIAARYIALRRTGLEHAPARSLAIREGESAALVEQLVPEQLRDAVRAVLAPRNGTR